MISHFTTIIYDIGICEAVCGGDLCPLVGHNAFLRWAAIKEVRPSESHHGILRDGGDRYPLAR